MLYPDFNELVSLKEKVSNLKLMPNYLVKSSISGGHFSPFRGHGLEFAEVRQYANGDDVRRIDWKVTARTGSPHVKLFVEERERTVLTVVDMNSTMSFGTKGTFKSIQAARCASYLGWCANKNSNFFGAVLFGHDKGLEYLRASRSRRSLWKMLQTLSSVQKENNDNSSIHEAVELANKIAPSTSLVFIISDFLNGIDEKLKKELTYLSKRCQVVLISVNDPIDSEIATAGHILFSSEKVTRLCIDTNSTIGRNAYQKQWLDRCQKLKDMVTNLGIYQIEMLTDRDVYFDLFYGLKAAERYRRR